MGRWRKVPEIEDPLESTRGPARDEHRSITLGDLAAVAIVMVLPTRQSYWPYPTDFLGPWPRWLPWCFCLRQALGVSCLVASAVVLRRRAAYGGLARPAEFLAICAAMPLLAESIDVALLRLSYRLQTGIVLPGRGTDGISSQFYLDWHYGPQQVFKVAVVLAGVAALVGFLIGRRRWPGWLRTALLAVAWLGAYESGPRLTDWAARLIVRASGSPPGETAYLLLSAILALLPRFTLYVVPAATALRDLRRRDGGPRPTWLEWTSLGLAVALFSVAEPTELIRVHSIMGRGESWIIEDLVRAATMVAALILGLALSRALGRAGDRNGAAVGAPNGGG